MNGKLNGNTASSATGAARHASAVLQDSLTLAELQWQLLAADCRESRRRLAAAVGALLLGLILLTAALGVALLAAAELLKNSGFSPAAAYGITSGGAALAALAVAWIGWRVARAAVSVFSRSREELAANVETLRRLLGSRDRPHPSPD